MENLIKMDDLGVPLFLETSIYGLVKDCNCKVGPIICLSRVINPLVGVK